MSELTSRVRGWVVRHFFTYLAVVMGVVVAISMVLARDELAEAWRHFDRRWVLPVLALSLVNYGLRFLKWQRLLWGVDVRVPLASSARIYFACFSMVVTPFRIGELYKLVFLRKLHGVTIPRSAPVLVVERLADGLAILALSAVYLDLKLGWAAASVGVVLLAVLAGQLLAYAPVRRGLVRAVRRLPLLRRRADAFEQLVEHHLDLLRPRALVPALLLSVAAWGSECIGLHLVLVGLGATSSWLDATWIYAVATGVGNLTFLPGGLGSTEASLVALLAARGLARTVTVPATLLVRAATLWFAVALGLGVALRWRQALRWSEVQAETTKLGGADLGPAPDPRTG